MDVLVYVVDCLRRDHVSCYGSDRETTPTVDALAEDGVRYDRCYAPATWTRPSSVSLLTGTYPPTHGVRHREHRFGSGHERLPQLLAAAGMRAVGVSTMGNVSSALGYDLGFDAFLDLYKDDAVLARREQVSTTRQRLFHEDLEGVALPRASDVNRALLPEVDATDGDLFSFCWCIDPHMPLDPPERHRTFLDPDYDGPVDGSFDAVPETCSPADLKRLRDLYDGEVRSVDEQLGELVEALRERGRYEDTAIVVLGDHGEAFGEHGFRFHGNRPNEELARVPLVVKPPGGTAEPTVVEELCSLVDVLPTVLAAVGADQPEGAIDGQVLPPFGPATPDRPVFVETQVRDVRPAHVAVRQGRYKYLRTETPSPWFVLRRLYETRDTIPHARYPLTTLRDAVLGRLGGPTEEWLFDLEADPGERRSLLDDRPEVAARLRTLVDDWLAGRRERAPAADGQRVDEIDAGTRAQLQQLGYTE